MANTGLVLYALCHAHAWVKPPCDHQHREKGEISLQPFATAADQRNGMLGSSSGVKPRSIFLMVLKLAALPCYLAAREHQATSPRP